MDSPFTAFFEGLAGADADIDAVSLSETVKISTADGISSDI
jgi:hypothetical protein